MNEIAHYINNAHIASTSGNTQAVFNPATGTSEKSVALASVSEIDAAVAAAKAAWPAWSKTPALKRARILDKFKMMLWERADQLAEAISSEHGKTHDDAVGEVTRGLEVVEFASTAPTLMKGEVLRDAGPWDSGVRGEPSAFPLFGPGLVTPQTRWPTPHKNA